MKRIITVQDLIDELMSVKNKESEINIVENDGTYHIIYTPSLYDFSVIDYTDDEEAENRVVIEMFR